MPKELRRRLPRQGFGICLLYGESVQVRPRRGRDGRAAARKSRTGALFAEIDASHLVRSHPPRQRLLARWSSHARAGARTKRAFERACPVGAKAAKVFITSCVAASARKTARSDPVRTATTASRIIAHAIMEPGWSDSKIFQKAEIFQKARTPSARRKEIKCVPSVTTDGR